MLQILQNILIQNDYYRRIIYNLFHNVQKIWGIFDNKPVKNKADISFISMPTSKASDKQKRNEDIDRDKEKKDNQKNRMIQKEKKR